MWLDRAGTLSEFRSAGSTRHLFCGFAKRTSRSNALRCEERYESPLAGRWSYTSHSAQQRQTGLNFTGFAKRTNLGEALLRPGSYTLHRHYDPLLMRFTSPDPIASPFYNLFGYALNNPSRFYDPDGLSADSAGGEWTLFWSASGAFFGGVWDAATFAPRNAFRSAGNLWDGGSAAVQGDWDGVKGAWNEQWSPITDLFTADGASNATESVTEKFTPGYYADQVDKAASAYGRGDAPKAGKIWGGAAFDLVATTTVFTGGVGVATKIVPAVGKTAARDLNVLFSGSRLSKRGGFLTGPSTPKGVRAGQAGRFADLDAIARIGDNLTPHHMPQAALRFTSRADGGALVLPHSEHVLTRTYAGRGIATAKADAGLSFRQVLAKDFRDVRGIAGSKYNRGLHDLLKHYRTHHPRLMAKPKKK